MITPTKIQKTIVTYSNAIKRAFGGYGYARYGMSLYGDSGGISNLNKNTILGITWTSMTSAWSSTLGDWNSYTGSAYRNVTKH